jgi:NADPH-dependent 2,4-dienoyl-CoA reductase/sulfur reductase-like enzyme/rhodanese-related sulfurtransferase
MSTPRTIVIVGGVAGGASAAARARRMNEDARIIVLEKDPWVSYASCGLPYYVGDEIHDRARLLVATPALFETRFKVEIRTGHRADAIDRAHRIVTVTRVESGEAYDLSYDRLILAPGASPIRPPLPGLDAPHVFTLRTLRDADRIRELVEKRQPRRAVVVGAGFIGLEMVEQLIRRKVAVSLVELTPQVLPPLDPDMAHRVEEELRAHDVDLHLGDALASVGDDGAAVLQSGRRLAADLIILGIGVRPNVELARAAGLDIGPSGAIAVNPHLQTSDPSIYAVGDAAEQIHAVTGRPSRTALAGPANRSGRIAGEHAATDHAAPAPKILGTAILRIFGLRAGMTGLSLKAAQAEGYDARTVVIEASHHAGWYPGAEPMLLRLVYAADGRILGAQAIGGEGVDKRIDVIATAIHFKGKVQDLAELDLAYSPQFGSARDPIHVVGFAATNEQDDLVSFLPPDAALDGRQIVDVRTDEETAQGTLPGAIRIPLHQLRERLAELDPRKPTVVVCKSGLRAWVASRILRQRGFHDVADLTGGMVMRRHAEAARHPAPILVSE